MEPYVQACECGGRFRRGSVARCPHCNTPLSAEVAASWIEANAPGAKMGWCWQRKWSGTHCIIIEERWARDNFR